MRSSFVLFSLLIISISLSSAQNKFDPNGSKIEQIIRGSYYSHNNGYYPGRLTNSNSLRYLKTNFQRLDSLVSQNWDANTGQWIPSKNEEYVYNEIGDIIHYKESKRDVNTGQLIPYKKGDFTYNGNSLLVQSIEYKWDGNMEMWVPFYKVDWSYSIDGYLMQYLHYGWDKNQNLWVPIYKGEYQYSVDKKDSLYVENRWDLDNNQWTPNFKSEYFYDNNGFLTQRTENVADRQTGLFGEVDRITDYTSDARGLIIQSISNDRLLDDSWVAYSKIEYMYDNNDNPTLETFYGPNESYTSFNVDSKIEYTYNQNFNISELIILPNEWFYPEFKEKITNQPIDIYYYDWDDINGEWITTSKDTYFYSEQTITSNEKKKENNLNIYPNPFKEYININLTENNSSGTFELFDVLGKKVLTIDAHKGKKLYLSNLTKGFYTYKLNINGFLESGTLLKE